MRAFVTVLVLVAFVLPGCGGDDVAGPEGPWTPSGPMPWNVADGSVEAAVAMERAKKAAGELGTRLVKRLTAVVEAGGFEGAIDVCKAEAPRIAAEVGTGLGLRIGRTSDRLRSPGNAPPPWAEAAVAAAAGKSADEVAAQAFRNQCGAFGVLLPIPTKGMCLACHGNEGALDPGVLPRLARLYPDDRATGFAEGELRGWFWVELAAK